MATMIWPLRRATQVAAEGLAVRCGPVRLTYGETWERCRRLVGGLRQLGLGQGDRVAVLGPNCHRYLEIYQAVPGAGMVLVPLNQRHTAAELRYALQDSGARVLFSGHDKGVMLTHRNLIANAFNYQACLRFSPDTRWLIIAPLFHAVGSIAVLATVWNAGQHVTLSTFDPAAALDLVETERVTATLVVPTMLAALSAEQLARPRDISTLGWISHGGAPVATETLRRARAAFPGAHFLHIYGTTETSPIATVLLDEERLLDAPQVRSCGQPAVGVEVAVASPDGSRLSSGAVGEVIIRGANVMRGYWNKPDQTAAALADGWYHSGDLGYLDDDGYLYLVDRAKDMIITGGENVYSTEVEEVLYRHAAVLEAAVFGIPDSRWGEAVHAVVVPREEVTEDELIQHCRAAIAGYKVPKHVELRLEPLPKSGAGKVLKRELRKPFWKVESTRVGSA
jgi:long-chain acyl-CoA synthetase